MAIEIRTNPQKIVNDALDASALAKPRELTFADVDQGSDEARRVEVTDDASVASPASSVAPSAPQVSGTRPSSTTSQQQARSVEESTRPASSERAQDKARPVATNVDGRPSASTVATAPRNQQRQQEPGVVSLDNPLPVAPVAHPGEGLSAGFGSEGDMSQEAEFAQDMIWSDADTRKLRVPVTEQDGPRYGTIYPPDNDPRDRDESAEPGDSVTSELESDSNRSRIMGVLASNVNISRQSPSVSSLPKTVPRSSARTFSHFLKAGRERIKRAGLFGRSFRGTVFYETMQSDSRLFPHEVSIGTSNLRESLREPDSYLLSLVNSNLRKAMEGDPSLDLLRFVSDSLGGNPEIGLDAALDNISLISDAINMLDIEVVLEKAPVNVYSSVQVRTLRVHYGRGIGVHPSQLKAYNADFDGDPGNLNLDQRNLMHYSRSMTQLVDVNGSPTIDPDFWPYEPINEDAVRSGFQAFLQGYENDHGGRINYTKHIASDIAKSFSRFMNNPGDTAVMADFFRDLDSVARKHSVDLVGSHESNRAVSVLFKAAYDYSIQVRGVSLATQTLSNEGVSAYAENMPKDVDPFVYKLIEYTRDVATGRVAPNMQDFTLFVNKYYGEVSGRKNVPFRLLADYAKAVRRTDLLHIGTPLHMLYKGNPRTVTIEQLMTAMMSTAESLKISGVSSQASYKLAVTTQMRTSVRREVPPIVYDMSEGAPSPFEQWNAWVDRFIESYNRHNAILQSAQVEFRSGFGGLSRSGTDFEGIADRNADPNKAAKDLASALVKVYSDVTVERLFPSGRKWSESDSLRTDNTDESIAQKYRSMTIGLFSVNNMFQWRSEVDYSRKVKDEDGNDTFAKVPKFDAIASRLAAGQVSEYDVMMLVADRRSKQFGEFDNKWNDATSRLVGAFYEVSELLDAGLSSPESINEYAGKLLEIMTMISPDLFEFYGMVSAQSFIESKYGKLLVNAGRNNNVDLFRSTLLNMQIEYRLHPITQMLAARNEAIEDAKSVSNETDGLEVARHLDEINGRISLEADSLASSSIIWDALVQEFMGRGSGYQTLLRRNKGRSKTNLNGSRGGAPTLARDFWNTEPAEGNLLLFLQSARYSYDLKCRVIADVARVNSGYPDIKVKEVMAQLACHPDRMHTGNIFDQDSGVRSDINAVKESMDRLSSHVTRSPKIIEEEARQVLSAAKSNAGAFERFLGDLASCPDKMVHIDSVIVADALASIYDKTYDDSEKIKQQRAVNALFELVSLQRNGGFQTHLCMTDNNLLGIVGYDQLTPLTIVRVLADPTLKLKMYDESGATVPLSREALCGGTSIWDVLRYLENNPRVALYCRRFVGNVSDDVDGTAYLRRSEARKSECNPESMFYVGEEGVFNGCSLLRSQGSGGRVLNLLVDRPRFLAIASLVTPTRQQPGRALTPRVRTNLLKVCRFVEALAYLDSRGKLPRGENGEPTGIETMVRETLGLTSDDIVRVKQERLLVKGSSGEYYFEDDPSEIAEFRRAADKLVGDVVQELNECVRLVRNSGDMKATEMPFGFEGIDAGSVAAYYDALQQMSGARTAKMIGIEGSETKKNQLIKEFVRDSRWADHYMMSEDGDVVEIPEGPAGPLDQDLSLERDRARQISSLAKFLESKRENGAEKFNAKAKKYGDDGTNSMIKFLAFTTRSAIRRLGFDVEGRSSWSIEDAMRLIDRINSVEGSTFEERRQAAVPILAQAIIEADRRMGYIENDVYDKSDYWNIAYLMIGENADGTIAVRSIEQLSTAISNRISDEAIESGSRQAVHDELLGIMQTVGTDRDAMLQTKGVDNIYHECVYGVNVSTSYRGASERDVARAVSQRASSEERNYALLKSLYSEYSDRLRETGGSLVTSRTLIQGYSRYMFHLLSESAQEDLKGVAYPKDRYFVNDEGKLDTIEGNDWSGSYDYLGCPTDKDFNWDMVVPGPQSMVLIRSSSVDALSKLKERGNTALFFNYREIPEDLRDDALPVGNGFYIVPFFDMLLNGSASDPIMPAPGVIPVNPDNVTVCFEDTTFEMAPGDATFHPTKELIDRVRVFFSGTKQFTRENLFPNADAYFGNKTTWIGFCTAAEVRKYVLNGTYDPVQGVIHGSRGDATIDLGSRYGTDRFAHDTKRFNMRLKEYSAAFESGDVDENGILTGDTQYDSIVGFVKIVGPRNETVLAPLWAFHLDEGGKAPNTFRITDLRLDVETQSFNMSWTYSGSLVGQTMKFFEGIGASNKAIVSQDRLSSRQLMNGLAIDGCYASSSVASRFFASNKRLNTMSSLFMMPRVDAKYAYNFADFEGSFPNKDTILVDGNEIEFAQALREGRLGIADWKNGIERNGHPRYHVDDDVNSLVKLWVDRCISYGTVNPSMLLSTYVETSEGRRVLPPAVTEWDAFMDTSHNYENAMLKFFHLADSSLCPDGINGSSTGCLFVPSHDGGDEYGVLKMWVPHYLPNGDEYRVLENVYISLGFFGDDFSGIKRVSANASNRSIDSLNVASALSDGEFATIARFARMRMTGMHRANGDIGIAPDGILVDSSSDRR